MPDRRTVGLAVLLVGLSLFLHGSGLGPQVVRLALAFLSEPVAVEAAADTPDTDADPHADVDTDTSLVVP
jgi:hypothetical protein